MAIEASVVVAPLLALILLTTATMRVVQAFPSGAPLSACGHLMPIHEGAQVSETPPPYLILMSQTNYSTGEPIKVTVVSSNAQDAFLAFMLQGRTSNNQPVGHFSQPPVVAKLLSCYTDNDTLSHAAAFGREAMEVLWHPPAQDVGDVFITGSIAKSKFDFWAVKSQPILGKKAKIQVVPGPTVLGRNSATEEQSSLFALIFSATFFLSIHKCMMG